MVWVEVGVVVVVGVGVVGGVAVGVAVAVVVGVVVAIGVVVGVVGVVVVRVEVGVGVAVWVWVAVVVAVGVAAMTNIRIDNERENANRKFACGIGPDLPEEEMMAKCRACDGTGQVLIANSAFTRDGYTRHNCWYCGCSGEAGINPDPEFVNFQRAARAQVKEWGGLRPRG